jgi:hypothetical protein
MGKIYRLLWAFLFLTSCQMVQKNRGSIPAPKVEAQDSGVNSATSDLQITEPAQANPAEPIFDVELQTPPQVLRSSKVALVLGPSGVYSFAAIGVFSELQKMGAEISAVVGYEYSAIPGALFARKGQAFDLEWQMLKLPSEFFISSNLVGREDLVDARLIESELEKIFRREEVQSFSRMFSCPSWNSSQGKFFQIAKGSAVKLIPFCLGNGIQALPVRNSFSAMTDYSSVIKFLKSRGFEKIIFVSFFKGLRERNIIWSLSESAFEAGRNEFDYVLDLPLDRKTSLSEVFKNRREIIKLGAYEAKRNTAPIQRALNLKR